MVDAPASPSATAWAGMENSLKACITQAWPEIHGKQHPIFRVTQAEMRPWRSLVDSGDLVPPWVVWSAMDTKQKTGWGACNVVFCPLIQVLYCIDYASTGSSDAARFVQEKYGALEEVLRNQNYDGFQFIDGDTTPDIGENNPANRQFIASVLPFIGASITFRTRFGYILYGQETGATP